jgi:hypothetical protein
MTPVARVDSNAVAQRPAHLVTVRPGQHHVEDDRVEGVLPRHPDAVSAVVHDIDGETFGLEPLPKPGGEALLREPAAPAPIPRAGKPARVKLCANRLRGYLGCRCCGCGFGFAIRTPDAVPQC